MTTPAHVGNKENAMSREWTPGQMKVVDAVGAGLQLHVTLPHGFKFDQTGYGADGRTEFMVFTMRDRADFAVADARWVQFETSQWAKMQVANAARIADCWNACAPLSDPATSIPALLRVAEAAREAMEACGKANACASLPDHTRELCRNARTQLFAALSALPASDERGFT